jgi:hypothetical protein
MTPPEQTNPKKDPLSPSKQDRFALSNACLTFSKTGKLSYGLSERLCLKLVQQPQRQSTPSSIQTATKNRNKDDSIKALWTPRQSVNLKIRNESPRLLHLPPHQKPQSSTFVAALQERERRYGYNATQNKGAARCIHTAYGSRVYDASRVVEALRWPEVERSQSTREKTSTTTTLAPYLSSASTTTRSPSNGVTKQVTVPVTAPGGSSPTTWDIVHHQAPFRATSSRFAAHAAADERRLATPDPSPGRDKARLELHTARRASRELKMKALQALADTYPHGLPTARRLSAEKKGLGGTLGGLGYGNSAQSMPDAQYNAIKNTLRLP